MTPGDAVNQHNLLLSHEEPDFYQVLIELLTDPDE